MKIRHLLILLFYLVPVYIIAQSVNYKMVSFGSNPVKVNDTLYLNIKNASNLTEKFNATLDLVLLHKKAGNIDSVLVNSNIIYKDISLSSIPNRNKLIAKIIPFIVEAKLNKGLYDDALVMALKSVKVSEQLNNKEQLS